MSLRSLGSLLARRFSPRATPRAHAPAPAPAKTLGPAAAGRPARSLHSLRDLAAGGGAYTGAAAAALVFGFLCVMKGSDESAGEVTGGEEAGKGLAGEEEARKQGDMMEEAAVKEDNDSDFSLENYLAEMTELAAAQKKARHERELCAKKAAASSSEAMTEEDMKEEAAMEARFEEWMGEYGRRYKSEEEKARRYELFKAFAKMVDKATAQSSGGAVFVTNHTADWTEEECRCLYDENDDDDWDDYLDHIRSLIDQKNAKAKKAIRD